MTPAAAESASKPADDAPTSIPMSRGAFFRQSGWMVMATVVSGLAMYGVHPLAKVIPQSEYGIFGLLVALLNCLAIPSIGLQMMFAQQTAAALTPDEQHRLSTATRGVLLGMTLIWVVFALVALVFQEAIVTRWKISNPLALWITLLIGLAALCTPVLGGIVQGKQNFLWLGWASVLNGLGRVATAALLVLVLHAQATGMVAAILASSLVTVLIYGWHSRDVWRGAGAKAARFEWRPWFRRVVPLTLGFGAFQFMFSADPLFVQAFFDKDETGYYIAAGTLARALVAFTGPVVSVMFPKIVRSLARSERTDVMGLTLITTGALAVLGALVLSLGGSRILTVIYTPDFSNVAAPWLPWFAGGMVPLALANVLVNDLLARNRFAIVPWLVVVALGYGVTLTVSHGTFLGVIKTIGLFNSLFLAVGFFFSWRERRLANPAP